MRGRVGQEAAKHRAPAETLRLCDMAGCGDESGEAGIRDWHGIGRKRAKLHLAKQAFAVGPDFGTLRT